MNYLFYLQNSPWLQDLILWIPNWKWVALLTGLIIGLALQKLFVFLLRGYKRSPLLTTKLSRGFEFYVQLPIENATAWTLITVFWYVWIKNLELPEAGLNSLGVILSLMLAVNLIRLAYLGVEAIGHSLSEMVKKTETELDDQLVPFAVKTLKVLVVILGLLILLQNNGVNVVSILAGLGLGGLALALAAQDTAANLFGSITILADRPFKVGDYVKIGDTEGTVEEIGFRSTRIRTFYESVVSIPNATVAKEKVDNMGLRPRRRVRHDIGLTYDTQPEKIKAFCSSMTLFLKQHPQVDPSDVLVEFVSMGDFSLIVRLNFYTPVTTVAEELAVQSDVLKQCLTTAKELGVEFAFPTQTIYKK